MTLFKCFLQGMHFFIVCQPFNSSEAPSISLHRQYGATFGGFTIYMYSAGATIAGIASYMGSGKTQYITQVMY
ncbi:hypothetical protein BH18ACT7_BH18ACT7_17680 [soil metagenome]